MIAVENTAPAGVTVSTPTQPSGTHPGATGTPYSYSTGGSTASDGNGVQYQFTWGDGTYSGWLSPSGGTASAQHAWSYGATYSVTAQARSTVNNAILSSYSSALGVTIIGVSAPNTLSGTTPGTAGVQYTWTASGAAASDSGNVQYYFDWGDGINTDWLASGTTQAPHTWTATGSFTISVKARSAGTPSAVSAQLQSGVTINDSKPVLQSFTPTGGTGSPQIFTSVVRDYAGFSSVQVIEYWFSSNAGAGDCHLAFFPGASPATGEIYLDAGYGDMNAWIGHGTIGQSLTLSNNACNVNLASSSASGSGQNVTLAVSISFSITGGYTEHLSATNSVGNTGWANNWGQWNTGSGNATLTMSGTTFHYNNNDRARSRRSRQGER